MVCDKAGMGAAAKAFWVPTLACRRQYRDLNLDSAKAVRESVRPLALTATGYLRR